jgi:hypothetical protein
VRLPQDLRGLFLMALLCLPAVVFAVIWLIAFLRGAAAELRL